MRTVETEKFVVSASLSLFLRVSELASANTQVFKLQTAKDTFPKKERCWAMSAPWPVFPFLFFFPLAFLDKLSAAKEPESHFELFIVSKTCFFFASSPWRGRAAGLLHRSTPTLSFMSWSWPRRSGSRYSLHVLILCLEVGQDVRQTYCPALNS